MKWNELEIKVKKILATHLKIDPSTINCTTNLENDLEMDQYDSFMTFMEFENEFDLDLNDNRFFPFNFEDENLRFWTGDWSGKPFKQKTVEDLIWSLGYEFNYQNNSNCIESDFISIGINKSGIFKVQLNNSKTEFINSSNFLYPAGLYAQIHNKWDMIIRELEELINYPKLKEYDLQKFLEKHPELIMENDYDTVIPEATITTNNNEYWSADFILKPINQFDFCKIIELKRPSLQTYLRDINRHSTFSSKLYKAINQLKDYWEAFCNKYTQEVFSTKYKFNVYKPDLHLIIGRKWDVTDTRIILDFQRRHNLKIETWDDFLCKLKKKYS